MVHVQSRCPGRSPNSLRIATPRSPSAGLRAALCAILGAALAGCSDRTPDVAAAGLEAQVVYVDPAEVSASGGRVDFKVGVKRFKYLRDLKQLDGDFLRIVRGGVFNIREVAGSLVQSKSFEGGDDPDLRYHLDGSVVVPRDYPTLAMISSYYQYEQVFDRLEAVAGRSAKDFIARSGKLKVMFEPVLKLESGDTEATANLKLNAAYVSGQKQFILFQRSAVERTPLAVNLQVIAHEFGHALFEQTFFKNRFEECDDGRVNSDRFFRGRLESEYALRGMNEGFSDFLSYAIVGGTDILRGSIDIGTKADQRDFSKASFNYDTLVRERALVSDDDERACAGSFYCIGTLFVGSLYRAMPRLGLDRAKAADRAAFARDVVAAVAVAQDTMRNQSEDVFPAPSAAVKRCEPPEELDPVYDGQVAGAFLAAVVSNLPAARRTAVCTEFASSFGERGFPQAARDACL